MKELRRRDFLRYSGYGLATILVGCGGGGAAAAAIQAPGLTRDRARAPDRAPGRSIP